MCVCTAAPRRPPPPKSSPVMPSGGSRVPFPLLSSIQPWGGGGCPGIGPSFGLQKQEKNTCKHMPAPGEGACSFYSCVSGPAWASSLSFLPPDFPSDVLGHPRLLVQSSPRTPMIYGDGSSPHLQTHFRRDPLSKTDLSIRYCGCSYRKIYFQSLFFYI